MPYLLSSSIAHPISHSSQERREIFPGKGKEGLAQRLDLQLALQDETLIHDYTAVMVFSCFSGGKRLKSFHVGVQEINQLGDWLLPVGLDAPVIPLYHHL